MKEAHLDLPDLVLDTTFVNWVKNSDPEAELYWQAWLEANPDKEDLVEQARLLVAGLGAGAAQISSAEKSAIWAHIQQRQNEFAARPPKAGKTAVRQLWPSWVKPGRIAAALLFLLGLTFLWWQGAWAPAIRYATGYGEIKQVALPDGSLVYLNANSELTYQDRWPWIGSRLATLRGEAYFAVTHTQSHKPFRVALTDGQQVEVLGTRFNIKSRESRTEVVLETGRVAYAAPAAGKKLRLQPGDQVTYNPITKQVRRQVVDPAAFVAWKDKEWVLNNHSLRAVAQKIEETFGVKVIIKDAKKAEAKLNGVVPANNLDVLLLALQETLPIRITRHKNQIIIL